MPISLDYEGAAMGKVSRVFSTDQGVGKGKSDRNFRLIDRNDGRQRADAKTCNDAADHHHRQTVCERLQSAPNEKNDRSVEDGSSTTDQVANSSDEQGGNERSDLQNGNNGSDLGAGWLIEVVLKIPSTVSQSAPLFRHLE